MCTCVYIYIYFYMYRIDWRNWKTLRAELWHVGILLTWLIKFENFHTFDGVVT